MHTEETVVVGDSANLASVSMFHACRSELPYDNDGLALVLLGGVLVGSVGDDLGDGDRLRSVSGTVLQASCGRSSYGTVGLRHHEASEDDLVEGGIGTAWRLLALRKADGEEIETYERETCKDEPTA